jgi:uncharacterized protein HemX
MVLLDAALPAGTPPWIAGAVAVVLAMINTVGLVLVARAQRAGSKDTDLVKRVETLEANEPADLKAARELAERAAGEAKTATDSAERVAGELKRHLEEEQRRRDLAREIGQKRDEKLAEKVDDLKQKVTTLAAQTELLLDGRVDVGGGSRRGR